MPSFKYIKFSPDGGREYFLAASKEGTNLYGEIYYRENGPAVIKPDGTEEYYSNGMKNRVVSPTGYQEYWSNGRLSRKDGPAIIYPDGGKDWLVNGLYHRKDGPAREFADGTTLYFYEGKQLTAKNDKEFLRKVKLISLC